MSIKLQPGQIPQNSGVYFFRKKQKILYIGKAANLRSRLRSYFNKNQTSLKTQELIMEADNVSWEVLNSETEALIREAELIKKHQPKYNVLMRDDKQYFYVGFTKEFYPKIFMTHQPRKPSPNPLLIKDVKRGIFIGPFTEGSALKSVLKTLRRVFPYCTCKHPHDRPCLNARIGRCLGFCCAQLSEVGLQSVADGSPTSFKTYQKNIRAIKQVLSGNNQSLARDLRKEMQKLSDAQKYENAGKIRNQIAALEKIFAHREIIKKDLPSENLKAVRALESLFKITGIERIEAYDIADIHGRFAYGSMAVWENESLNKNAYRLFKIRSVSKPNDPAMLKEILTRRFNHPEWPCPDIVIVDGGMTQLNAALKAKNLVNEISRRGVAQRDGANINFLKMKSAEGIRKFQAQGFLPKVIALTKDKRHRGDHIFIQNRRDSIPLSNLPESLKNLILLLDSEAHRFAISHYRKSHRKSLTREQYHANLSK